MNTKHPFLALVTLLAACTDGSAVSPADATSVADTATSDGDVATDSTRDSADDANDANDGSAIDTETTAWMRGRVSFETYAFHAASGAFQRGHHFRAAIATEGDASCAEVPVGGCVYLPCGDGAGTADSKSAGSLTLTKSPSNAPFPIVATADAAHRYADLSGTTTAFAGGDEVTLSASGSSDIPAFTTSAKTPALVWIDAPAVDGKHTVAVTRSEPLQVTFHVQDGQTAVGRVEAIFFSESSSARLICRGAVADGGFTVPSVALAKMPAGAGGLYFMTSGESRVVSGRATIDLRLATFAGAAKSEGPADGPVTYE
jgi:hypothetical protein